MRSPQLIKTVSLVSVVIPAFNEEQSIATCLEALSQQKTSIPFEVIVVDNCSTDATAEIARRFSDRLTLRVIRENRKGRGYARSRGFAEARGQIIFSTDADTIVPQDWIERFRRYLESHPEVIAVTGAPLLTDCGAFRNAMFNAFVPLFLQANRLSFGHVGLHGFSFAIWRSVYEACGGFDEETDAYEDLVLAMRAQRFGKIVFLTRAKVIFSGRRFSRGLLIGWYEYIHTFFQKFLFKKRRVLLADVGREE